MAKIARSLAIVVLLLGYMTSSTVQAQSLRWETINGFTGPGSLAFLGDTLIYRNNDKLYALRNDQTWQPIAANQSGSLLISPDGRILIGSKFTTDRINWTSIDVDQGYGTYLAIDSSGALYGAGSNGLGISTNWKDWIYLNRPFRRINRLSVTSDGQIIVEADSIYKSLDQGKSWITVGSSLPAGDRIAIENITITDPNHWAGFSNTVSNGRPVSYEYFTTDAGNTWRIDSITSYISAIQFENENPQSKWFRIADSLETSIDEGATWQPYDQPFGRSARQYIRRGDLEAVMSGSAIGWRRGTGVWTIANFNQVIVKGENSLFYDDAHSTLFVSRGTYLGNPGGPVYSTSDNGETWIQDSANGRLSSLSPYLFASADTALFRTSDGGITWTRFPSRPTEAPLATGTRALYDAEPKGVYESIDFGATWRNVFSNSDIECVGVDASQNVYAGVLGQGVYLERPGADWVLLTALNITNPYQVISANDLVFVVSENGISYSSDQGTTWSDADSLQFGRVYDIEPIGYHSFIMSSDSGVYLNRQLHSWQKQQIPVSAPVYFSYSRNSGHIYAASSAGVLRTVDPVFIYQADVSRQSENSDYSLRVTREGNLWRVESGLFTEGTILVTDVLGRVLNSDHLLGRGSIGLTMPSLAKGMYYVMLQTDIGSITTPVIVE